ncbi:hypothetical protein GCK72_005699 [Caenorhabditis remanei]|uniref:KIF-binding protein n=1 Tax=Caenorhabditis remanei TaxID=31234 RepID=A0A6A5HGA8_CAERE|nr:hypothetical protein GCK72_005699 [Caenorhabditis remanei]KAF1765746.1 hypothetical protein GCK72_005699 [Caenorhabditis remanei]
MSESKAKNMLQKLSLTPKRNHENDGAKSVETEEDLLYKLKAMQEENDYTHIWMTYEKLATLVENRSTDKTRRPEYGKLMFYYQSAAQALVKIWKRDSLLPFEQYLGGDVSRLYNKAIDIAVRYMDPTVVHTVSREAGIALMSMDKYVEARDVFVRGEQQLEAVTPDCQPDFMERLIVLYGIMNTLLIEERWNDYMVYTDKIWMMTMKEDKRCPLLENIIKEVEQIAVLLLVYQKKVECSERHKQLLASYRMDDWQAPITRHNPPLSSLSSSEQKVFRRFLFYVTSTKRSYEKCSQMIPKITEIVARPFRIEVYNDNEKLKNRSHVAIYSRTSITFFHHSALNYSPFVLYRS